MTEYMECTVKEFIDLFTEGLGQLFTLQKVFADYKDFDIDYVIYQESPELIVRVSPKSFWEIGYKSDSPTLWKIGNGENWRKLDTAAFMEKHYRSNRLEKPGKRIKWQAHDLTDICDRLPID